MRTLETSSRQRLETVAAIIEPPFVQLCEGERLRFCTDEVLADRVAGGIREDAGELLTA